MTSKRTKKHPKRHPKNPPDQGIGGHPEGLEWVGGRMVAPFFITEGTPYRPEMILWVEMPEHVVVHFTLVDPNAPPISFADTLFEAMDSPIIGPPRQPQTVRVADSVLAREISQALPQVRVIEAPTPELAEVMETMAESMAHGPVPPDGMQEPSYLEDGRVGIEAVENLFRAAKLLYGFAPWKTISDGQVLRVDIPAYDIEGGCLSVMGALGKSVGLILFPSLAAFVGFLEAAEAHDSGSAGPAEDLLSHLGSTLSLNFETGAGLPKDMYREALKHGWPVADSKAYPMVMAVDAEGIPRPLCERDVRVISACALSFTTFFIKHKHLFESDSFQPVCESFHDGDDLEVRFTAPAQAGLEFEVNRPRITETTTPHPLGVPRSRATPGKTKPKIGRNRPCPCGSGKKYKLCCLNRDQAEAPVSASPPGEAPAQPSSSSTEAARDPSHDLDEKLLVRMNRYAERRWGQKWAAPAVPLFRNETVPGALMGPWMFYEQRYDGKPLVQWFQEDEGHRLPRQEADWIVAQRASWLSVWEVLEVDPGKSATLKDLLTQETRVLVERTATKTMVKRDAVLARVVDYQGRSVFCGMYPSSLPPRDAAGVVQRMHKRLRRKSAIPVERMQEEAVGRFLIRRWEEALEEAIERTSRPPQLANTDGDPLLITSDHFEFDPADRKEIAKRMAKMEGVDDPPKPRDPEPVYVFTQPGDFRSATRGKTITGTVALAGNTLRAESNSIKRADAMRGLLEAQLGTLVRHRLREHADPVAMLREDEPGLEDDLSLMGRPLVSDPPPPPSGEELDAILLQLKGEHYADWADHPIPILDGKTPREAMRTKDGREKVDMLLKENENMEARLPAGQRFDFGSLRRELGLPE